MPTIAIVGAGPGLGLALARQFGREGFTAALVARNESRLAELVETLTAEGIETAAFVADTADIPALEAALVAARARFGGIDVLEFSPYAAGPGSMLDPRDVTVDALRPVIESHLFGAVAAIQNVLPAMRAEGSGTILLTAGIGSIEPVAVFGALNTAQAATRNLALNLNGTLADSGVHVAHVAIGVFVGDEAPEGRPHRSPAEIADRLWQLHTERDQRELVIR
ncbi:MAG: SDR family NAD(P)-dependent oxidoreductase [Microbacterium sp.]|jgi:NADP-dependent 3-hydroxy acid dehydrogenase YdfG|nr:SDR family NAD(P)-dependent oxidoreductase [Microbacterium sp.]